MQVSKWGNSLAIRLPAAIVESLRLKEGDHIEVLIADERTFEVTKDSSREAALARLRQIRQRLPPGFKFNREEAYER